MFNFKLPIIISVLLGTTNFSYAQVREPAPRDAPVCKGAIVCEYGLIGSRSVKCQKSGVDNRACEAFCIPEVEVYSTKYKLTSRSGSCSWEVPEAGGETPLDLVEIDEFLDSLEDAELHSAHLDEFIRR